MVAAGILLSRIIGLVRQRAFAHYFGTSDAADALSAAFRIPNLLQNLFGEGTLSASFIPVYASLRAREDEAEAKRLAGAVAAILGLVTSVVVLAGVLATPVLVDLLAPGFEGAKRDLTITLVRVLFPGVGVLVLSAWCLGVLNSHRRFFLSYAAPVVWNLAIIGFLVGLGAGHPQERLALAAAWGSVAGSVLQFALQLPPVLRFVRPLRLRLDTASPSVRTVVRNFVPAFVGRGVVQISAYVDTIIASLLPSGAPALLYFAQMISTLPVSLFGMSITAAELPEMASAVGGDEAVAAHLRNRLRGGLQQIAFFVVPSAVAFLALGQVIAAALYQSGRFTAEDSRYVWAILAASAVGLLSTTLGRLYSSAYYALHDTRTPMRYALLRVGVSTAAGVLGALWLPRALGLPERLGVVALPLAAGVAGWLELHLLRRGLERRIGRSRMPSTLAPALWGAAAVAALLAWGVHLLLDVRSPLVRAIFVLGTYGVTYVALTSAAGLPQAREILARVGVGRGPAQ